MKPEIGFMSLLRSESVLADLTFAAENGFNWFELALDWKQNYDLEEEIVKKIKALSESHNIKLIIHTPYYLPTSSLLPEIKQAVIKNVGKAILLAHQINSDRLTIHPGINEMPRSAKNLCIHSLIDTLKEVVDMGKKLGVCICLENFNKGGPQLCSALTEFIYVLNSVEDLRVTLDVGHSNTTDKSPTDFFTAVKNNIMNIHVHDNNGKSDEHKCPGEGNIEFIRIFEECKKARYYGPFILEIFPYENILKGKKVLSALWERA